MIERERFEAWARQRWTHPEDFDQRIKAPSKYNNYEVQAAWEGWQEALRIEREKPMPASILSDRVRAGVEAAPWVVDEIRRMEAWMDAAKHALHQISLCSQNSTSSQRECGRIARAALTPAPPGGAERKSCGSCKRWIDKRRIGDKEGSGSCDRIPMQWQAEPGDALAFVTDGELYFAQLRTMPSFCCAHYEAITPSAESSSTSPAGHAAAQTASDPP